MWRHRIARFLTVAGVAILLAFSANLSAQVPPAAPLPPALPPLLYLRLAGPEGMKVTLYRGEATGVALDAPCVVGVRPGYAYRIALSNLAGFPGTTFSPTIEIRGSLWLAYQLRNADFPATIVFRNDDFNKAEQGGLVKKVVVLEDPELAEPTRASADRPLEYFVAPARNLQQEVQGHGAPLAIVYLGQRTLTAEELAASAIPGTLLLPGEKTLPAPRVPPWIPWGCYPVFDPLHGPLTAAPFTNLYDGGDSRLRAGHDGEGRLRGLDPSDTVAEYVDPQGRPRVVPSNRVALCVPRFVIVRTELGLASHTMAFGPGGLHGNQERAVFDGSLAFVEHSQPLHLESARDRLKPSATQFTEGAAVTGRIDGLEIAETLRAANTLDGSCPPPRAQEVDRPLRIIKWPDKKGCNVGDLVTFSLRYTNNATRPITNVVVSDSLTPRFEYVPGSQKADRESRFTLQPNEAGSAILRWEFPAALQPGESGLITFQVRVR